MPVLAEERDIPMKKIVPEILKPGDNPDCIHVESIIGRIGVCLKCARVVRYPYFEQTVYKSDKK